MSKYKKPSGRVRRLTKGLLTRITVEIPMLMRQAIRDREKMGNISGSDVVKNILLTALRVEMEIIHRRHGTGESPLKAV